MLPNTDSWFTVADPKRYDFLFRDTCENIVATYATISHKQHYCVELEVAPLPSWRG